MENIEYVKEEENNIEFLLKSLHDFRFFET